MHGSIVLENFPATLAIISYVGTNHQKCNGEIKIISNTKGSHCSIKVKSMSITIWI